jgi:hypothetical protein
MYNLRRLVTTSPAVALAMLLFLSMAFSAGGRATVQASMVTRSGNEAAFIHSRLGLRQHNLRTPGLAIEPFVRPDFATRIKKLRPHLLATAARHNPRAFSGLSNEEFATALVLILWNENNGWLEDDVEPLRFFTPLYQDMQRQVNSSPLGGNFSVWPANLRPSVALEILRNEVPLADGTTLTVPLLLSGSRIVPTAYTDQEALFAAITGEISQDGLAIEYLAANLARAVYRAHHEGMPVTWRTLAAWHNQGLVDPQAIRANPTAHDYLRRAAAYLTDARAFVRGPSGPKYPRVLAE